MVDFKHFLNFFFSRPNLASGRVLDNHNVQNIFFLTTSLQDSHFYLNIFKVIEIRRLFTLGLSGNCPYMLKNNNVQNEFSLKTK